jgi:hypothetical protein
MSNRNVVERYTRALGENDGDALEALRDEDYVCRYPQSGEVIRGRTNARAIGEQYPGSEGERGLSASLDRIVGSDDQFLPGPSWNLIHLSGSGDEFTVTGTVTYPNGETWHAVALLTLRGGRVWREVDYFAAPFERPEWRAPFTELENDG